MPRTIEELAIRQPYGQTLNGARFYQFDTGMTQGGNRVILFYTIAGLSRLCDSQAKYCDGTFKSCPKPFKQLYTVHGVVGPYVYPLIFCLAMKKNKATYALIFNTLKQHAALLGLTLNPRRIVVDFEMAAMSALREIFPEAEISGCLFHWGQSVWRKSVSLGLKTRYNESSDVKRSINIILALPFLPLADIIEAFVDLQDVIDDEVRPLWRYVDETYVRGRRAWGRRRAVAPLFPPSVWNVYQACLDGDQRTNNFVESWHARFAKHVATYHPNIWKFLDKLRKEIKEHDQQMTQIVGGHRRVRRPIPDSNAQHNTAIEAIVGSYEDYRRRNDIETYLRAISYRLKRPKVIEADEADEEVETDSEEMLT